jgi:predicted nucleotidyltransferase
VIVMVHVDYSRDELAAICRRRAVKRLALFGSVLRDDFGPESDVDVLVEFDHNAIEGKQIYLIYDELSRLFGGREVDLVEPEFLNPRMRRVALESAEEVYAA